LRDWPIVERADVTLGIDLAAQPAGTAACRLAWGDGEVTALTLDADLDDGALTDLRGGASMVAIDAPFGWPRAYLAAMREWDSTRSWPKVERQQLRYRATDLHVQQHTGIWPLSPSSDRIAVCAWRCAALLASWGVHDPLGADRVVEAYPAAAMRCWGLPSRGYKAQAPQARARTADVRAQIIAGLRVHCPWLALTDPQWDACLSSHDLLDALICALVARATCVDATLAPSTSTAGHAAQEGWIQLPDHTPISKLCQPARRDPHSR
jgi:predicted nuclease with RNAse H fold